MSDIDWTARALCGRTWNQAYGDTGTPPDWFGGDQNKDGVTAAVTLCRWCPVAKECLTLARTAEAGQSESRRYGIYAGTTPAERAAWDVVVPSTKSDEHVERREAVLRRWRAGEDSQRIGMSLGMKPDTVTSILRRNGLKANPRELTRGTAAGL